VITAFPISVVEAADPTPICDVGEAKVWGNIDHPDDDDLIEELIEGSTQDIEGETGLKLVPAEVTAYVTATSGGQFMFPYGFPETVTVETVDSLGAVEDADESYYLHQGSVLNLNYAGSYKITYTVALTVPRALKEAVMMLVVYRYNNRGEQEKQVGLPEDIERKIQQFKMIWL
jgi:hypothetical protein